MPVLCYNTLYEKEDYFRDFNYFVAMFHLGPQHAGGRSIRCRKRSVLGFLFKVSPIYSIQ